MFLIVHANVCLNAIICMLWGLRISNFQAGYAPHKRVHNTSPAQQFQAVRSQESFCKAGGHLATSRSWARGRGTVTHFHCNIEAEVTRFGYHMWLNPNLRGRATILWAAAGSKSRGERRLGLFWFLNNTWTSVSIKQSVADLLVPKADTSTARKAVRLFF